MANPNDSTVSPLFNKMDALMARHRSQGGKDIPVLTQETEDIPTLTDELTDDGLMFDPADFHPRPREVVPDLHIEQPKKPVAFVEETSPVFLDLPILDLDGLADNPLGHSHDFELEIDEPQDSVEANSPLAGGMVLDLEIDEPAALTPPPAPSPRTVTAPVAPVTQAASPASVAQEIKPDIPVLGEEEIVLDFELDEFEAPAAPVASIPKPALATHAHPPVETPAAVDEEIDLAIDHMFDQAEQSATIEPEAQPIQAHVAVSEVDLDFVLDAPAESASAEAGMDVEEISIDFTEPVTIDDGEHHLTLSEHAVEHPVILTLEHEHEHEDTQPENAPLPVMDAPAVNTAVAEPVAVKLGSDAIAEITASVGAQIAVDISSEVAQLTRQHFSVLMKRFYDEALHKLTEEISRDMEMTLVPRIEALVQEELRRQKLID